MQESNELNSQINISAFESSRQEQLSDDQLLTLARTGDKQAFGQLCVRYWGMLKRAISRIIRNQADTEDLLQNTLLRAYLPTPAHIRGEMQVFYVDRKDRN